ncbi:MAG: SpoIIE family protein phosphatase [Ignavibacteriaceae bacterium]|jgi:sigma-B regulation protein RsbU (phosphoserine phosphatase)|nr:SpoIIE family protein phosphatase [Ignavibacteriaceae bacterium]
MPEKMLVVDDEPDLESLIRQRFRKKIREGEYDFVFASNGLEALARLLEHKDIGVILSDINMPEMDGLTLLAKLNELKNPALRTVIVSAYGDMDNIRTAMNRGAYDFVTKPVDFTDLETTIEKTINELELIRNAVKEHDKLLAIQYDLDTARSIQSAILPKIFPPFPERNEFEIFASMEPAKEVGGDLYDFFLLDNDRLGFVIADVSGKGVPAAIFMAVSRTLIRATALKGISPEECLTYVNSLLCQESVSSMFVTVFYGILNFKTGELNYTNGGHNPPYILSKDGELLTVELTDGIALGVIEGVEYKNNVIQLKPGDTIFTFTDGVTEAMDVKYELYSEERLEAFLKENHLLNATELVKEIFVGVHKHAKGAEQSDDITVLSINYHGNS